MRTCLKHMMQHPRYEEHSTGEVNESAGLKITTLCFYVSRQQPKGGMQWTVCGSHARLTQNRQCRRFKYHFLSESSSHRVDMCCSSCMTALVHQSQHMLGLPASILTAPVGLALRFCKLWWPLAVCNCLRKCYCIGMYCKNLAFGYNLQAWHFFPYRSAAPHSDP